LIGFRNQFVCFNGYNPKKWSRVIQYLIGRSLKNRLIVVSDSLKGTFPKSHMIYNGVNRKKFYNLHLKRKYIGWIERDYCDMTKEEIKDIAKMCKMPLSIAINIPPEKMNEWYNSLKAFASYPPEYAGFNMCWIEAKSAGVPLILGNNNGIGLYKVNTDWESMTWENNVDKLLEIFGNEISKQKLTQKINSQEPKTSDTTGTTTPDTQKIKEMK
jgi:hypothetical protein